MVRFLFICGIKFFDLRIGPAIICGKKIMSVIEEKCKQKGVRLTEQRRVIAKVMSESKLTFGSKDHPDVDELHKRVSLLDKKISIATVYRTLNIAILLLYT